MPKPRLRDDPRCQQLLDLAADLARRHGGKWSAVYVMDGGIWCIAQYEHTIDPDLEPIVCFGTSDGGPKQPSHPDVMALSGQMALFEKELRDRIRDHGVEAARRQCNFEARLRELIARVGIERARALADAYDRQAPEALSRLETGDPDMQTIAQFREWPVWLAEWT